mgnify:CR=1 FL=1
MRKLTLIPLLSLIFMLNVASTCSSDDSPNSSADPAPVINTVLLFEFSMNAMIKN